MDDVFQTQSEQIRLFVNPEVAAKEVTPGQFDEHLTETKKTKSKSKHKRNQYHELAIMAQVDRTTTETELERLLHNEVRTLIVQKNFSKPQDLEQIFLKLKTCLNRFYEENLPRTPIGVAVEISGELLITGRMRNDQSVLLQMGEVIVLTNNEEYRNCCFKEVLYVSNLWRYMQIMRLGDDVVMGTGREIVAKVVKCCCMVSITVKVTKPGLLTSFMNFKVPHYNEAKELNERDIRDIDEAMEYGPHFLMIPGIRSAVFLKSVREHIGSGEGVGLIGSIDLQYLESKFIDIADCLMELDAVVLDDIIYPVSEKLLANAIAQCKRYEKPLIGRVPLKSCKDFKNLENHKSIKQMDCLLIQKSPIQMKFPLIAKKLLPVGNNKVNLSLTENLSCKDGIINFVLRTIYSIPCQGLVVTKSCFKAAVAFSNPQIYCPVIVVVENDRMAMILNLMRNLKTVVCEDKTQAMDLGIEFGRRHGFFSTGDFIISISDTEDKDSQICVNLRAYFLPPNVEEVLN